jgi:hypothetical protein
MAFLLPAAIGGSALIGGITSMIGANKAASAARDAARLAQQRYTTTRGDLQPYNAAGQAVLPTMNALAMDTTGGGPDYVSRADTMLPPQMTQAELEATPGYQFVRDQGLKAVAGTAAARSLGVSGAALKMAGGYATGLANTTYKDQFNIAQQRFGDVLALNTAQQGNLMNRFSRVSGIATLGENAGAQTGSVGATLANTAGNYLNQAGVDAASGIQGIGNAVTGAAQSYLGYRNFQDYLNSPRNTPRTGAVGGNLSL